MNINVSQKQAILVLLSPLFLVYNLQLGSAASGGRMGGEFFSSETSQSSSKSDEYRSDSHRHVDYPSRHHYYSSDWERDSSNEVGGEKKEGSGLFGVFMIFGMVGSALGLVYFNTKRKSVIKLQVGLWGKAKSLHNDLNNIAEAADTSTLKGLTYILTETTLALLRHPDYCISAHSCVNQKWNTESIEKCFKQHVMEEREKFDVETLVNVNNVKIERAGVQKASRPSKEYIVVTILVAAEGSHKVPAIKNIDELKEALVYLGSICSRDTLAVEVLWTPQNDNDTLSEHELLENYPLLMPI